MAIDYQALFDSITRRYGGADPQAFAKILTPILIPIRTLDKAVIKLPGQSHYRATFTLALTSENQQLMQRGRNGKFVPGAYVTAGTWREIAKGRIIDVDSIAKIATGEVYIGAGGTK